jgi:Fur family ferric uptake transcriptional regulator
MRKLPAERSTRQKRAIRDVFERENRPLNPAEVLAEAQRRIRTLGSATVYRSIRALLDEGWLEAVDLPGRAPFYERSGKEHHHNFLCTACDRAYELTGCSTYISDLPRGFHVTGHGVTIYGTCPTCRVSSARRAG